MLDEQDKLKLEMRLKEEEELKRLHPNVPQGKIVTEAEKRA